MSKGPARDTDEGLASGDRPPPRLPRSLAIGLLRAREAVMSHFRPILAANEVTEQQWRVLRLLTEAGVLDASEVCDKAAILAPSLTRMIRSLEERGLISKHRDDADGRRVLLRITDAGQTLVDEVMPESQKAYAVISERFGSDRIDVLLQMLDELATLKLDYPRGINDGSSD